jgi:hypothetical protein
MSYFLRLSEVAGNPLKCHVCSKTIALEDQVIEHGGYVNGGGTYGLNGGIAMHPECATILVLRLAADVVKQPSEPKIPQGEARVLHVLRDVRNTYNMKGN